MAASEISVAAIFNIRYGLLFILLDDDGSIVASETE